MSVAHDLCPVDYAAPGVVYFPECLGRWIPIVVAYDEWIKGRDWLWERYERLHRIGLWNGRANRKNRVDWEASMQVSMLNYERAIEDAKKLPLYETGNDPRYNYGVRDLIIQNYGPVVMGRDARP